MKIKNDSLFSIKVSSKGREGIIVKPNHEVDIHECDQVSITNVIGKKTFITCGINGGSEVDVTYNGRNSLVLYSVVGFVILEWVLYYFKIPTINEFVATTILGYLIILIISIVYPCYSFINKSSFAERDNKTKNLGDVFFYFILLITLFGFIFMRDFGESYYVLFGNAAMLSLILPMFCSFYVRKRTNFMLNFTYKMLILYSSILILGYMNLSVWITRIFYFVDYHLYRKFWVSEIEWIY